MLHPLSTKHMTTIFTLPAFNISTRYLKRCW